MHSERALRLLGRRFAVIAALALGVILGAMSLTSALSAPEPVPAAAATASEAGGTEQLRALEDRVRALSEAIDSRLATASPAQTPAPTAPLATPMPTVPSPVEPSDPPGVMSATVPDDEGEDARHDDRDRDAGRDDHDRSDRDEDEGEHEGGDDD
jgi:hypothetical protein